MSEFRDRLQEKKRMLGWTTEKLAEKSGIPVGTINKILNGETRSPRYDTMQALEQAWKEEEQRRSGSYVHAAADSSVRDSSGVATWEDTGRKFTIEDYKKLPDQVRAELINGKLYLMASPTVEHQIIVTKLVAQSMAYIQKKGGDCVPICAPMDVQLDEDEETMLQPDFLIVCEKDRIREDRITGAPDFIVEVLSPSTRMRDGNLKLRKYMEAGVREYWIVDPERQKVITYWSEEGYLPNIYSMEEEIPVKIYHGDCVICLR